MKETTVTLSDEVAEEVDRAARRCGRQPAELIPELIALGLAHQPEPSLPAFVGIFDDPRLTNGADVKRELARTWADAIRADS